MPRVVIVGGGISGLSTAHYLAKAGIRATIVESRPRLGGVIQTEHVDGCTVEAGPDSFLSAKPAAMDLIRELGLEAGVIGSNDADRITYVRKHGRLVPLPDGMMMMVPTKVMPVLASPLLSWGTKLHMGLELVLPPPAKPEDQSVADFVREHYGQEAVDYLAEPLLSGIYGGDPERLSLQSVLPRFAELARQYGSLTRGVLASRTKRGPEAPIFRTLKGGLGQLVDALRAAADVIHGRAEAVEPGRVRVDGEWLPADRVVLACEAYNAAALISGQLRELLAGIGYTSAVVVALGFRMASPPKGFGFLVPKKERRKLLACTWVGNKFAHRVPAGLALARCFFTEEASVEDAVAELREIADIREEPVFSRVYRWPRAMAQYEVGHAARVAEVNALARDAGLLLAGNAYTGIGIPDCIRMGKVAAESIISV